MGNPRHLSATAEHYTPPEVIAVVRATLDRIDLDPASCATANAIVRAGAYYTEAENGLSLPWFGRVFCNPPGGLIRVGSRLRSAQKLFWWKLAGEFASGRVQAACFLSFSIELMQTTQIDRPDGLWLPVEFPFCLPSSRVAYMSKRGGVLVRGTQPPHASALFLLTRDRSMLGRFVVACRSLGAVVGAGAAKGE
jgi:hypothetical protein